MGKRKRHDLRSGKEIRQWAKGTKDRAQYGQFSFGTEVAFGYDAVFDVLLRDPSLPASTGSLVCQADRTHQEVLLMEVGR